MNIAGRMKKILVIPILSVVLLWASAPSEAEMEPTGVFPEPSDYIDIITAEYEGCEPSADQEYEVLPENTIVQDKDDDLTVPADIGKIQCDTISESDSEDWGVQICDEQLQDADDMAPDEEASQADKPLPSGEDMTQIITEADADSLVTEEAYSEDSEEDASQDATAEKTQTNDPPGEAAVSEETPVCEVPDPVCLTDLSSFICRVSLRDGGYCSPKDATQWFIEKSEIQVSLHFEETGNAFFQKGTLIYQLPSSFTNLTHEGWAITSCGPAAFQADHQCVCITWDHFADDAPDSVSIILHGVLDIHSQFISFGHGIDCSIHEAPSEHTMDNKSACTASQDPVSEPVNKIDSPSSSCEVQPDQPSDSSCPQNSASEEYSLSPEQAEDQIYAISILVMPGTAHEAQLSGSAISPIPQEMAPDNESIENTSKTSGYINVPQSSADPDKYMGMTDLIPETESEPSMSHITNEEEAHPQKTAASFDPYTEHPGSNEGSLCGSCSSDLSEMSQSMEEADPSGCYVDLTLSEPGTADAPKTALLSEGTDQPAYTLQETVDPVPMNDRIVPCVPADDLSTLTFVDKADGETEEHETISIIPDSAVSPLATPTDIGVIEHKEAMSLRTIPVCYLDLSSERMFDITVTGYLPDKTVVLIHSVPATIPGETVLLAFDISLADEHGQTYLPDVPPEISIEMKGLEHTDYKLYHFETMGEVPDQMAYEMPDETKIVFPMI